MDVLEAFDLTRSYRSAAELCGVDHHTLRRYVAARDAGLDPTSLGTGERGSGPSDSLCKWSEASLVG